MAQMLKVKARWQGFNGAPGYTNFYFRDFTGDGSGSPTQEQAAAAVTRVQAFFTSVRVAMPSAVKIDVQPDVDVVEDSTGTLVSSFTVATPATLAGTSTVTSYSAPSGAVINWRTGGIRNGRRVRGRTFIVPLATNAYEADGSLSASVVTIFRDAGTAMADAAGSPDLGVWARPTAAGASDGAWFGVTGSTVPDKSAILRSRRD